MSKKNNNTKKQNWFYRIIKFIFWPIRMIWNKILLPIWNWIAGLNFIALLNLALLSCIIVLFTALIMDVTNNSIHFTKYASAEPEISQKTTRIEKPKHLLPAKADQNNGTGSVITVAKRKPNRTAIKQIAFVENQESKTVDLMGDVVIDNHDATILLKTNTHVKGNLYLQNMRKYTLPCNLHIDGNLFVRDLNMLNFCGSFTVKGNIYVSPRSSFGPIPNNANIGGQIIL